MKVLVTGGAGFIGYHLVDKLIEMDKDVTVIDNLSYGKRKNLNKKARFIELDILDYDKLQEANREFDVIYHLAANATTRERAMGWDDPIEDLRVNVLGTLNIFRSAVEGDSETKVIYASSAAVYGPPEYIPTDEDHPTNPVSPYGVSKLAGEKYALAYSHEYGIKTVIMRIFNTYGPRQPRYVMYDFLKKLKDNPEKLEVLGSGKQVRDYCYIEDTVEALLLAGEKIESGTFNVAGGNPISIEDLAKLMLEILELKNTKIEFTQKSWRGDISTFTADASKLEKMGFNPKTNVKEGISKLIEYFNENE